MSALGMSATEIKSLSLIFREEASVIRREEIIRHS